MPSIRILLKQILTKVCHNRRRRILYAQAIFFSLYDFKGGIKGSQKSNIKILTREKNNFKNGVYEDFSKRKSCTGSLKSFLGGVKGSRKKEFLWPGNKEVGGCKGLVTKKKRTFLKL